MGGEASKPASGNTASKQDQRDHRFDFFLSKVTKEGQSGSEIFKATFVNQFPAYAENLADKFFEYITYKNDQQTHQPSQPTEVITQQQCYEALNQVQSLTSTHAQLLYYIGVFCGREGISEQGVQSMLESVFIISMTSNGIVHQWTETELSVIKELVHTIASKDSLLSAARWMEETCPNLISVMHLFVLNNIYRAKEEECSGLININEVFEGRLLSMTRWWLLTSAFPSCFTQPSSQRSGQVEGASASEVPNEGQTEAYHWSILYSSQDHGLSLNRFKHHVFGYRGPTVLMLSCDGDHIYAVAIDVEWREGVQPWGGANCHIIRVSPNFKILEEGDNMVVFNEKSRNIPKGVWIGRDSKNRKLHIEEGFETVTHNFQTSKIKCIEVWGCGDSSAKAAQTKQKKTELKDAEKRGKVKLPGHWDDNPDKMLLEWGGVKVNHAEYAYDAKN